MMCVITKHSKGDNLNWMAARVTVWVSDHIRDRWLFRCYHLGSLSGIINDIHVCTLYVSLLGCCNCAYATCCSQK